MKEVESKIIFTVWYSQEKTYTQTETLKVNTQDGGSSYNL